MPMKPGTPIIYENKIRGVKFEGIYLGISEYRNAEIRITKIHKNNAHYDLPIPGDAGTFGHISCIKENWEKIKITPKMEYLSKNGIKITATNIKK